MGTKTLAEKLGVKPRSTVWISDPEQIARIGSLPDGVRLVHGPDEAAIAIVFVNDAASTRALLEAHRDQLTNPAALWIAYPKANRTDVNRDSLWPILSDYGMRPNSQVAIDDVWSALRFRPLKEGEERFGGGSAERKGEQ